MTKTQAAKDLALIIRVYARKQGYSEVTWDLVEARCSEHRHESYAGTHAHDVAMVANPKTVYRFATAYSL